MFRHRIGRFVVTICFAITSVLFLFSVNYVFGSILEPHQQMRIKVALGIEENLRGAGYNVNQSKIAIGSGGVLGKRLPQRHPDKTEIRAGTTHRLYLLHHR